MSDASPPWLCMVGSEAVCGGLIAHTNAVDELIMHGLTRCICHTNRIAQITPYRLKSEIKHRTRRQKPEEYPQVKVTGV